MEFISLEAEKKLSDTVLLTWTITPPNYKCRYRIYRRLNDAGAYVLIAETRTTAFVDESDLIINNRAIGYKIESENKSIESSINSQGDPLLYECAANYIFCLKEGRAGIRVTAYCRAEEAIHCTECWSEVQQKIFKSNCSTCDGSGWLYGYKGPIELYISLGTQREIITYDDNVERRKTSLQAWTANIPIFNKDDIIINGRDERFIVSEPPVYIRMIPLENDKDFIVKQQLTLDLLPLTHFAYLLEATDE